MSLAKYGSTQFGSLYGRPKRLQRYHGLVA